MPRCFSLQELVLLHSINAAAEMSSPPLGSTRSACRGGAHDEERGKPAPLSHSFAVFFFFITVASRRFLSSSHFLPSNQRKQKLTTPSAVRVSRLARWSNWNTPSPREPVQRSSVR